MTFTSDELFLALVSLVRATRPSMLRQDAEGFSIDFEAIAAAKSPLDSDRLLLKLGAAMQGPPPQEETGIPAPGQGSTPPPDGVVSLDVTASEARQLAGALAKLEQLQAWPEDVLAMSRALRARLASAGGQ